jgi:hypothetical protein
MVSAASAERMLDVNVSVTINNIMITALKINLSLLNLLSSRINSHKNTLGFAYEQQKLAKHDFLVSK